MNLLKGIAKYAIGFGVLAYVLYANWDGKDGKPGIQSILQQTPDWSLVVPAALLMIAILTFQITRWFLLVKAVGLPFTPRNAMRLGLVGYYYNMFLPGSIGGDLVKAYFIAKDHPTRRPVAVATVVIDRMLGLFGLVLVASTVGLIGWSNGEPYILKSEYLQSLLRATSIIAAVIILGWLLIGILPEHRQLRFEERLHHLKPRKLGQTLAELWFAVRTYRKRSGVIYLSVLLSVMAHLCMVLQFHLCTRIFVLQEPAPLDQHAVIAPIGFIAQVFFPAPGGVGGGEAIFGFLYKLLDRPEVTGVMGRFTLRCFEWAFGLLGFLMFLNMKSELASQTEDAPSPT